MKNHKVIVRSLLISIEHAELLGSSPSLVLWLCLASNHGNDHGIARALRLGPTQPVTNLGIDE